ncbi:MAG TPA: RNA polymerase sigma factor [Thermoleophilaceae bacterium]|nr:RNA polymerase sigma factor [Thermoleophilaceae bacterium]
MDAASVPVPRGRIIPLSARLLRALDDERLVARIRAGDERAFEVLYDRHHRGLLSLCRHLLGSHEEAEDALQQTFASANRELFEGTRDLQVRAWLYTIARNRCLTTLRARREQPAPDLERASTTGLAEEVEQRADLKALVGDLRDLPEEQRSALVLSEVGGLSHAEIAATLGCEVSKVKSLVFQARSGLIERRDARETPCEEIREQLSVLTGGSLRRGPIRRHLKACPGCREFREEVRRQRVMLGVVLPVIPSVGLKESVLAALGVGGGGAAAGGGVMAAIGGASAASAPAGGSLAGGLAAALGKAGTIKLAAAAIAGTAAAGGGVAVVATSGGEAPPTARPAAVAPAAGGGTPGDGAPPAATDTGGPSAGGSEISEERREEAAARRREARERAARARGGPSREAEARRPGRAKKERPGRARPDRARERSTQPRGRERATPRAVAPAPRERSPAATAPTAPEAEDDSDGGAPAPGQGDRKGKGRGRE